jgi:hypothetical protein
MKRAEAWVHPATASMTSFGIARRYAAGRRIRVAPTLLPVFQRRERNAVQRRKSVLRHVQGFADRFTSGISTVVTRRPGILRPPACAAACFMLSISSFPNLLMVFVLFALFTSYFFALPVFLSEP